MRARRTWRVDRAEIILSIITTRKRHGRTVLGDAVACRICAVGAEADRMCIIELIFLEFPGRAGASRENERAKTDYELRESSNVVVVCRLGHERPYQIYWKRTIIIKRTLRWKRMK